MNVVAPRRSPLADWRTANQYVTRGAPVWLQDFSWRERFGCKGPAAGHWLASQGLTVPTPANSWAQDANDILVARLATSEFLVEAMGPEEQVVATLRGRPLIPGVYPVIRQDAVFELGGRRASELLLQVCSYPFDTVAAGNTVVMTSMIGVGVTVIPRPASPQNEFRIWCDPSFGLYLWSTLVAIGLELGGGAIASDGQGSTTLTGES